MRRRRRYRGGAGEAGDRDGHRTEIARLRDLDGRRDTADASPHPVLVVDRTPTLTAIAAPYRRRTTSWDESTGSVGEWWRWQTRGQSSQIDLEFGPPATLRRYDTPPSGAHHATVGNAPAVVWTERTGDLLTSTVTWTDSPGRDVRLTLLDESTHPLSESALVELADSLREAGADRRGGGVASPGRGGPFRGRSAAGAPVGPRSRSERSRRRSPSPGP